MSKSRLCDQPDVYILVKGNVTVPNTAVAVVYPNDREKVIFKNYAPCTDCISEINNTQADSAKDNVNV